MYVELYLDSVFLMNFVMDMYLLLLTGRTIGRTATRLRLCLGSAAGAGVFCLLLLARGLLPAVRGVLGYGAAGMLMAGLVFGLRRPAGLLRAVGYLYTYAFLLGGMMRFLFRQIPFLRERQESVFCILGMGFLGYQGISWALERKKRRRERHLCRVVIETGAKEVETQALIDTGNGLREPVSGRPVCVIDRKLLEQMEEIRTPEKFKLIPFHSVGKKDGLMEGYEAPAIRIEEEMGEIVRKRVILAVSDTPVSPGGGYRMILHPELMEEEKKDRRALNDRPVKGPALAGVQAEKRQPET